jgi:SAM-dependent methyltransferase
VKILPKSAWRALRAGRNRVLGIPAPGAVNFGDLRRLRPISRDFGTDRGLAIDRYYIEKFLAAHATDVQGRVLEVGDDRYARRYGGERVARTDIWHATSQNARATIVGDLANPPPLDPNQFDCVILTQTLQLIETPDAALGTVQRLLKPGGVLLLTVPCITSVVPWSEWGPRWYWGFTGNGATKLLQKAFGGGANLHVELHGNVLSATAFLHGLAAQELTADELDHVDADYQVIVAARAVKRVDDSEPRA